MPNVKCQQGWAYSLYGWVFTISAKTVYLSQLKINIVPQITSNSNNYEISHLLNSDSTDRLMLQLATLIISYHITVNNNVKVTKAKEISQSRPKSRRKAKHRKTAVMATKQKH